MTIQKGDKEYTVTERKGSWKLSYKIGMLTLEYVISKDICENQAELAAYVQREEIIQ